MVWKKVKDKNFLVG
jgi:hypothetical protein